MGHVNRRDFLRSAAAHNGLRAVGSQPSVRLYDVFLNNTDPRFVALEMDIYWAFVGQYRYGGTPHRTPRRPQGGSLGAAARSYQAMVNLRG